MRTFARFCSIIFSVIVFFKRDSEKFSENKATDSNGNQMGLFPLQVLKESPESSEE
jgi:hypothetical protein